MQDFITQETLEEAGITLVGDELTALLDHLNETLEDRVGDEIIDALEDDQLEEFMKLQQSSTDEQVFDWIKQHVPEYEQIVKTETDILLGETAQNATGVNNAE